MANKSVLGGVYLFKDLSEGELGVIGPMATDRSFNAGEEIFVAGSPATSFFVITFGSVKIFSNSTDGESMGIANLGMGSHFGELPLFDAGVRSATAQATEATRVLEIKYSDLEKLMIENPNVATKIFRSCSRFLAMRLRKTLHDLSEAKEARLRHF